MSKRSTRHHFVPKVLQRQFSEDKKHLWYSERGENGRFHEPLYRNVDSCFWINNYYTVIEDEKKSDSVERKFYGKIDNYLGEMLPCVFDTFSKGNVPLFSGDPLNNLRQVVMQMAKRTPDFIKNHDDFEMGRELVQSILNEMDKGTDNKEREEYERQLTDPIKLKDYGRDIRNRATLPNGDKINRALEKLHVRWSKIETEHYYILSSRMAYRIGNGGSNGLVNPNMEIWMPIMPKIALVLMGKHNKNVPIVVPDNRDHIRQVNQYAMKNSNQIASHSKDLLISLINNE